MKDFRFKRHCFCSDYEAGGDNNYEAIPNRKYEVPDELPPVSGTRLPGIHLMSLPPIPESRAGNTEDFPLQLPPKKKPIHFIRDPNFLAHVSFKCSFENLHANPQLSCYMKKYD